MKGKNDGDILALSGNKAVDTDIEMVRKILRQASFLWGNVLALIAICALTVVFLGSGLTRDVRADYASEYLSRVLGQPVEIEGDVRVRWLNPLSLVVSGLRVPSEVLPDTDLAYLEFAQFALEPFNGLFGGVPLPAITARGLSVSLVKDDEGRTSWTKFPGDQSDPAETGLLVFLGDREVDFSEMRLNYADHGTGFEFDFFLGDLSVAQNDGPDSGLDVHSLGTINGQAFEASGVFPESGEFSFAGHAGKLEFSLFGEPLTHGARGDFEGQLSLQTKNVDDLLQMLRLDGDFEGTGSASGLLRRSEDKLHLENIDLVVNLIGGDRLSVTGDLLDQRDGPDFDLKFRYERYAEGYAPEKAFFLKDVVLSEVDVHLVGDGEAVEVASVSVETNAFEEELRHIGPFQVESVERTPDGRLELSGVTLSLGPENSPYIVANGYVGNLLTFEGYRLSGALDLPAARVLPTLREDVANDFGRALGTMEIAETEGRAELKELSIASDGSSFWHGSVTATARDLLSLEDASLHVRVGANDGGSFLEANRLELVDLGPVTAFLSVERTPSSIEGRGELAIERSRLLTDIDLTVQGQSPVIRGTIRSEEIQLSDLQNAFLATRELARVPFIWEDMRLELASENTEEMSDFKPLVLGDIDRVRGGETSRVEPLEIDDAPPAETDLSEFKPLVVEIPAGADDPLDGYKPLVLSNKAGDLSLEMFLDADAFLRLLDLEVAFDIARLTGQRGISSVRSDAIMRNGKLDFGPLTFSYGGGFVTTQAALDVIDAPDWLRVTGRTGGWDVGEALAAFGAQIGASGTLSGQFDLAGRHTPLEAFPRTMTGRATLEMENGRISTSLVELSGLGVVPWLFSRELRQGWANIACLRAPLFLSGGQISTEGTVLETDRVQLVARGSVNIANDRVDMRADPRPIGRPLSRSPWPIAITGALTNPNIGVASRRNWRALEPLAMRGERVPCIPDVTQLGPATSE